MFKNITIGQYYPAESAVHNLDPRIKIALTFLYIIIIFFIDSLYGYAVTFALLALVTVVSHIDVRYLLRGIKPMLYIIIFTFVLNIFFTNGKTLMFKWNFIEITYEGLMSAVYMALRLIFLITGSLFLTLTTSPINLTEGLERLMAPLKLIRFPVHELAMMMTIALRFIPTLMEEADKIMKAQSARGADFESGNLLKRAKGLIPLLVPLFISAFRRADELAMAMESRCYHGGEGRTRMKVLKLHLRDLISTVILAAWAVYIVLGG